MQSSHLFKRDAEGVPHIKIVIWGPSLAGKTSMLTVFNILKRIEDPDLVYSELKRIDDPSGRTIYYDQSIFELPKGQGTSLPLLRYQVWTVAGQERHRDTRRIVIRGADGIIIMFDPSKEQWEANKKSLAELKTLMGDELGSKIPFLVIVNKIDLPKEERTPTEEFMQLLVEMGLATNVGEAYMKTLEISCLEARNDLLALPRRPDWRELIDGKGRLKREARPESVRRVAQPIEQITRMIIENKIKQHKTKPQPEA